MPFLALLGPAVSVFKAIIGAHHVANIKAGASNAVIGAVEGFGWRFFAGAGSAAYAIDSGFRAGINSALSSIGGTAVRAVLGG